MIEYGTFKMLLLQQNRTDVEIKQVTQTHYYVCAHGTPSKPF